MSNKDRVLTVRITIKNPEEAKWLWEAHKTPFNGILVTAFSNGNMFKERDELAQSAQFFIREENEDPEDAISAHLDPFYSINDAINEGLKMYDPEVKWEVIDRNGNSYGNELRESF